MPAVVSAASRPTPRLRFYTLSAVAVWVLVLLSVVVPGRTPYTIKYEYDARSDSRMYWVYSGHWPFGMGTWLEAGFSTESQARSYIVRARREEATPALVVEKIP